MHVQHDYARVLGLVGDLAFDFIESPALVGNALGDSATRPIITYLPPGYDPEGSRRYPVLYCLHGYSGSAAALVGVSAWNSNVVQRIDRLIGRKAMPEALLVIVDGWTRLGGSQYVDSMHNGAYATYVVRDVIGHVDASFRSIAHAGGRAVLGKSSGGFGAMHLVMEHPGIFSAFASHSGDSYFRYNHPPAFAHLHRTLEQWNWNIAGFVDAYTSKAKPSAAEFSTIEMLGYASAYSPRSAKPFDLALPIDYQTGEVDEAVFARWLAFDPVQRVPQKASELAALRLRYLDCGRRDEYGLDIGARALKRTFAQIGCTVHHEEFDDDHRNIGYRYDVSLPLLANVLDHA
ncbi:MAG: alpha/beta hydrolase [Vulcanimicrobiaceae bacterium]